MCDYYFSYNISIYGSLNNVLRILDSKTLKLNPPKPNFQNQIHLIQQKKNSSLCEKMWQCSFTPFLKPVKTLLHEKCSS